MGSDVIIDGISQRDWDAAMAAWDARIRAWDADAERQYWASVADDQRLDREYADQIADLARRREEEKELSARDLLRKQIEDDALDAALASSSALALQGLIAQAQSGDDVTISIPSDIRVASANVGGPSASALSALIVEIGQAHEIPDRARRSIAWAIGHNYVPHPGDLGEVMNRLGIDPEWAHRHIENGQELDRLSKLNFRNVQLRVRGAAAELEILRDTLRLLDAYTPERSLRLVTDPRSILELPNGMGAPPTAGGARPEMGERRFHRMLDSLF